MKIIPAIDLKDNKCVRLTQGKEYTSIIYNENKLKRIRCSGKVNDLKKLVQKLSNENEKLRKKRTSKKKISNVIRKKVKPKRGKKK